MSSTRSGYKEVPRGNASTSNSYSRNATPFKVQVNFEIPIFEGHIEVDIVDKWLNLLEGYFSVHDFSSREKIIFTLPKATPHVKDWGKPTTSRRMKVPAHYFHSHPLEIPSEMPSRNSTTLSKAMRTNT
jgi:hypothetical protein